MTNRMRDRVQVICLVLVLVLLLPLAAHGEEIWPTNENLQQLAVNLIETLDKLDVVDWESRSYDDIQYNRAKIAFSCSLFHSQMLKHLEPIQNNPERYGMTKESADKYIAEWNKMTFAITMKGTALEFRLAALELQKKPGGK